MRRPGIRIAAVWLSLICSTCATNVTLDQIMADPGRYRGKTLALTGTVDRPMAVAGYGIYRISEGDSHLWVQTTKGVPRAGAVARVTGRIYDAYDVRGLPLPLPDELRKGVILLESSRTGPP
jgi:hypothetical protein